MCDSFLFLLLLVFRYFLVFEPPLSQSLKFTLEQRFSAAVPRGTGGLPHNNGIPTCMNQNDTFLLLSDQEMKGDIFGCCRLLVITLWVHAMKRWEVTAQRTVFLFRSCFLLEFVPIGVSCTSLTAVLSQGSQAFR